MNYLCFFVEGDDYSAINEVLVFNSTGQERRRSFRIYDDLLSEGLETFMLELRNAEGQVVNSSLVEIVDDESEWVDGCEVGEGGREEGSGGEETGERGGGREGGRERWE